MKGLIKYSWIFIAIAGALAFTACNKSSSSAPVTCPYGTVYNGATCIQGNLYPGGIPPGTRIGFYAQTSNFPMLNAGSVLSQGSGMTALLRDFMGVCDRQSQVGGSNGGLSACGAWTQGYHDMVLIFDGSSANQAKLVIRSYPYVDPMYQYQYSLPSLDQFFAGLLGFSAGNVSGVYDPLVLTMTVWPINGNQGFELRANGPTGSYGWGRLMQFQVRNGKIEDPAVNYTLYVDAGNQQMLPAATGTMVRCQTQNCGIQGL